MKNKRLLISALVLIFIIIAIALILKQKPNFFKPQKSDKGTAIVEENLDPQATIEQNLYSVGNYDLDDESRTKLIKSHNELESYLTSTYSENFDDVLSKYGDEYFADRALALAYVKLNGNNQTIVITSLNIDEDNLEIGYILKDNAENSVDAYVVLVETDKTLSTVTSVQL